jgi:hypothetical protein
MYANGTEITDFGTDTRDAQNSDTHINKTNLHVLGVRISTSSSFINMYVANAILIDGLQLDPTSFGEVTDDGFWQINDASGLTFGTNGFLIEGGVNMAAGTDSLTTGVDAVVNIGDSAGDWSGNTGSYSFGNGAGNEIKATVNDDAIYSNHVFSGDFDFDVGAYDIVMGEMGVFASDEVGTFLGADTNGNLDAMTNSFWIERGGAGGADRAFIGSVSEGALSHTDGANYRIERRSGTITLYKNDVSLHVFTSTYTGSMALFFGNGNTLFEAVDVTYTDFVGGNNFFKTGTITATNDSPTNGDA